MNNMDDFLSEDVIKTKKKRANPKLNCKTCRFRKWFASYGEEYDEDNCPIKCHTPYNSTLKNKDADGE